MASRPNPTPSDISRAFWDAASRGEFLLQQDAASGRSQFYPRPVNLFSEGALRCTPAAGAGTLIAVTTVRTPVAGFESPYLVGIVRLDEGPRVFAQLLNVPPTIAPGAPMRLIWVPGEAGHSIYAFEPA